MAVEVDWGVENRILYTRGSGNVTVAEFKAAMSKGLGLLETAPVNVHDVFDFLEVEQHPSLPQLLEFRSFFSHPKLGWMIIVSQNKTITFFSALIAGINNNRLRAFTSLAEALEFLASRDETLPNPLTPQTLLTYTE
ncbi:MAG: hypothetical protein IAE80_09245 [Anaerolinea sp.]|nr:hypothetical protein [Anaerolinea sp.]